MARRGHKGTVFEMEQRIAEIDAGLNEQEAALLATHPVGAAAEFLAFEEAASRYAASVADRLVERKMLEVHCDEEFRRVAAQEARQRFRNEGVEQQINNMGPNPLGVRLAGGSIVSLKTPYVRPSRKGLMGRPRQKRGPSGTGRYPVLEKLGVLDGVTPLTRSRIAKQVVVSDSYAEAREELAAEGLDLHLSAMVRVAVATGMRALEQRNRALDDALEAPIPEVSPVAGQRIRVSVDGGRARTRHTHHERRKQKNGRRAFDLDWKEPRIITVDVLDEQGDMDSSHRPIYEVELGDADEVYRRLTGLLRLIGANQASEVVFTADGASWIWARIDSLIDAAELTPDHVHKVLDYYHAAEHIFDALKACKGFSDSQRTALYNKLRGLLLEPGGAQEVIKQLSALARGRRSAKVNKEIRYLKEHLDHMRYAEWRDKRVPIGSGIVESAVRRVLNLRFKSASKCWRQDHLEPLLYLRAIHKAGRWQDFMLALLAGSHWLQPMEVSEDATNKTTA